MENPNEYLATIHAGPITKKTALESLLAACWDQFDGGGDGGMEGYKLLDRMESVVWQPPTLSFVIERHGGTVNGSSRAELQHWIVDLGAKTATLEKVGRRQLDPMQPRLDVVPLAEKVVALILNGDQHEWLKWYSSNRVHVVIGRIVPSGSAAKQTVEGRHKRLRKALVERLGPMGWKLVGHSVFEKGTGIYHAPH